MTTSWQDVKLKLISDRIIISSAWQWGEYLIPLCFRSNLISLKVSVGLSIHLWIEKPILYIVHL